jgi:hypothetical protein
VKPAAESAAASAAEPGGGSASNAAPPDVLAGDRIATAAAATPVSSTAADPSALSTVPSTAVVVAQPAAVQNLVQDKDDVLAAVAPVSLDEAMSMSLSPPQRLAIQLLTSGKSLVAAATAAGVNRTTLYRWLKADPAFVAAYNAWQKDVRDTARGRILALSDLAITTVAKAMLGGDAKSAIKILQATGALTHEDPGSTDPTEIQRLQRLERLKAQTALRRAETRAEMDSQTPF